MTLKGFNKVLEYTIANETQDNLIEYFDWGLLEKGNYFNVTLGEQDYNGNDYSLLKPTNNTNFLSGEAWEGFRKNWVWQSGVGFDPEPMVGSDDLLPGISGIYVDDTFYPADTTGEYAHNVDYFNGRVVFDSPISIESKVQAEYSYKYISVIYATSLPWLRELYINSMDLSNRDNVKVPAEMQIQLPAIAIEIVPTRTLKGYQLGPFGQFVNTDVLFHCVAEDDMTRNKLIDIVSMQNDSNVKMFDSNKIADSGAFPLNSFGYTVSGAPRYPELIEEYGGECFRIKDVNVQAIDMINSNLHAGVVRITTELISTKF